VTASGMAQRRRQRIKATAVARWEESRCSSVAWLWRGASGGIMVRAAR